jgi:hypothetical protein
MNIKIETLIDKAITLLVDNYVSQLKAGSNNPSILVELEFASKLLDLPVDVFTIGFYKAIELEMAK